MSNVLVVFGATGQQGSSVINHVLNNPELSRKYRIRAISRDVNSEHAQKLREKGIEVVRGDLLDPSSLTTALTGANTVFAMTTPDFSPDAVEVEYKNGKTIADIAVEKGVKYFIWSTLPAVAQISNGKYTKVTPFDAKAKIEQYIRTLPIKSAFVSLGWFMENFQSQPFLAPKQDADGTWVLSRNAPGSSRLPFISAVRDIGKFVGAILAQPDKYEGKVFHSAQGIYSLEEIVAIISEATGQKVVYKQVSDEDLKKPIPPFLAGIFVDAFKFQDEYGYFGPGTEDLVAWAAENAQGRLETLPEFFKNHPLRL